MGTQNRGQGRWAEVRRCHLATFAKPSHTSPVGSEPATRQGTSGTLSSNQEVKRGKEEKESTKGELAQAEVRGSLWLPVSVILTSHMRGKPNVMRSSEIVTLRRLGPKAKGQSDPLSSKAERSLTLFLATPRICQLFLEAPRICHLTQI